MYLTRYLLTCLTAMLIFCSVTMTCVSYAMAADHEPTVSSEQFGAMKNLVETADQFRLLSGSQPDKAQQEYFDKAAQEKWRKRFASTFSKSPRMLVDFFAGAVIWIGGITDDQRAVVCYYNPWSDIIFLSDWQGKEQGGQLIDLTMLTGEDFRGQVLNKESAMPLWLRQPQTPGVSIAQQYRDTLKVFNHLFPPFSDKQLTLSKIKTVKGQEKSDLDFMWVRLGGRLKMFVGYLYPNNTMPLEMAVRSKISELRRVIAGNNPGELAVLVERAQPDEVQNIFLMPPQIRAKMSENLYLRQGNNALVALVNPRWPLWFIMVHLNLDNSQAKIEAVELLQFDLTAAATAVLDHEEVR